MAVQAPIAYYGRTGPITRL